MKQFTRNILCSTPAKVKPYWTQSRLASRFGVSRAHMSLVLAGKRESQSLLRAVAAFVGPVRFRELAADPVRHPGMEETAPQA